MILDYCFLDLALYIYPLDFHNSTPIYTPDFKLQDGYGLLKEA